MALVDRFSDVMARPSPPLDEALMVIAAVVQPQWDPDHELGRLDQLAGTCAVHSVEGVLDSLFAGDDPFLGDRSNYHDLRNSLLPQVLQRRRGMPITLCALAIEVARRCAIPLVGVAMPAHFLVAVPGEPGALPTTFYDCFDGARRLDQESCRQLYREASGGDQRFDPSWLSPVASRHIVRRLLNNAKTSCQRSGDLDSLRAVMRLRAVLPELTLAEHDERARLMAPYN